MPLCEIFGEVGSFLEGIGAFGWPVIGDILNSILGSIFSFLQCS